MPSLLDDLTLSMPALAEEPSWEGICGDVMDEFLQTTTQSTIPPLVTSCPDSLIEFVTRHPFEVDHQPFTFEGRDYLKPIFDALTFKDRTQLSWVLMTGAQVAKSVTAMLALTHAAVKFWGRSFGYFLPDSEMSMIFSSKRFYPLINSCLGLRPFVGQDPVTGKKAEDRKRVRSIGRSSIYFSYMGGKTSTESLPMLGVWFDEVRRMAMQDVERASERVSASPFPLNAKISTARHPGSDIDFYYKRSTMGKWHSVCRCKEGVILADTFPECIGESKGTIFYRCPRCDKPIDRPADGRFIDHQPESVVLGWQIPQMLSPLWPAPRFWKKWLDATDKAEFYNSGLGLPYIDPESIVVTPEIAWSCVDPELAWQPHGTNCVMGVDQRGRENHVLIGWVGASKVELRHVEIIQSDDPFARLAELMTRYDVDCCVGDALPNYNDAVRFAKKFPRRVFLSYYSENVHMIRWSDRDDELRALLKTNKDAKHEWHVMLDRYKAIEWALMHFVNRQIAVPNPHGLIQEVVVKGLRKSVEVCLGNADTLDPGLFWHLSSIARRKVEIERRDSVKSETLKTGEFKMVWENIGIDPHFVHALTYMLVAGARRQQSGHILLLDMPGASKAPTESIPVTAPSKSDAQATAEHVQIGAVKPAQWNVKPGTCGACVNLSGKQCTARGFQTDPMAPVGTCWEYVERRNE